MSLPIIVHDAWAKPVRALYLGNGRVKAWTKAFYYAKCCTDGFISQPLLLSGGDPIILVNPKASQEAVLRQLRGILRGLERGGLKIPNAAPAHRTP